MKVLYRPSVNIGIYEMVIGRLLQISDKGQAELSVMLDIIDLVALAVLEGKERGFTGADCAVYPHGIRGIRHHLINLFYTHEDKALIPSEDAIKKALTALNRAEMILKNPEGRHLYLTLSDSLEGIIFEDWVKP